MFRENIGLFITEARARLYVPTNSGLNEYVNNLLRDVGVGKDGEFDRPGQGKWKAGDHLGSRGGCAPTRG